MTDQLIDRLVAARSTLDEAIASYVDGDVQPPPPTHAYLLAKVAAGVIIAGGVAAIPLSTARNDRTVEPASQPAPPTSDATDAASTEISDEELWAQIDWLFAVQPYGPEGNRLHHLIVQDRLEDCMNRRGFEYHQVPFTPDPPSAIGRATVPPLPTEDEVRAAGYAAFGGAPVVTAPTGSEEVAPATTDPELIEAIELNEALADEDPAWTLAIYGDETKAGTCIAEAFDFIDERVGTEAGARYDALTDDIQRLINPIETPTATLADAIAAWRECMGAVGDELDNPSGGVALFDRLPETPPTDDEISTALADLRCQQSSGFDDVYRQTIAADIAVFREENQIQLDDLAQATTREVEALRTLAVELGLEEAEQT